MKVIDAQRIWFISDIHLGVRNNSQMWLEIQRDYFYNFFIPLVKENKQEHDVLFVLGDVFESKHALNLQVLNFAIKLFEDLAEIFTSGVFVILGNHDVYLKSTNDIHSTISLKWIPGINVIVEPEILYLSGKLFFMMPWRKNHEEEKIAIRMNPADYLCCHADVAGLTFNGYETITEGILLSDLNYYKRVYSGHIHHRQIVNNVHMLGCPYQLKATDRGNQKAIVLLDIRSGLETIFNNDYSPKFISILFEDLLCMPQHAAHELLANNFVDIVYDIKWLQHSQVFSMITEEFSDARNVKQCFKSNIINDVDEHCDSSKIFAMGSFDIPVLAKECIDELPYKEKFKTKLLDEFNKIYTLANKM